MIRDRRIAAGLTQRALADAAGVHINTVQKWERLGVSRAEAAMLARAAEVLGCTVEDLLHDESGDMAGGGAR